MRGLYKTIDLDFNNVIYVGVNFIWLNPNTVKLFKLL